VPSERLVVHVVDREGAPQPSARVLVFRRHREHGKAIEAIEGVVADQSGACAIDGGDPTARTGREVAAFGRQDWALAQERGLLDHAIPLSSVPLRGRAGSTVGILELPYVSSHLAALGIRIVDQAGQPVGPVPVEVDGLPLAERERQASATDSRGEVAFPRVRPGLRTVTTNGGMACEPAVVAVEVAPGRRTDHVLTVIRRQPVGAEFELVVRCVDVESAVVASAAVEIQSHRGDRWTARSDASGVARIPGLPALLREVGGWVVVRASGHRTRARGFDSTIEPLPDEVVIVLEAEKTPW
jgi:hypothetical protein